MDLEAQWTNAANAAVAMVTTYGLRVVGAIIILVVGWMASRLLYTAVVRLCEKSPRIDRTVVLFLGNGVRYAAMVFTFVAVLTTFGIATTSSPSSARSASPSDSPCRARSAISPPGSCWSCSGRSTSAIASRPAASPARRA
jgi:Conserved TM helix